MVKKIIPAIVIILVGFISAWILFNQLAEKQANIIDETKYPYLSSKILNDYDRDLLIHFVPLRTKLREIIKVYGTDFAVYFEYLPTGTSIGINDATGFYAGSLLKVPIAMAYFHQREAENSNDDPMVTIEEGDLNKNYGSLWQKGAGSKIRLSEAVVLSLTQSDNTATNVLRRHIKDENFSYVYEGLDLLLERESSQTFITPKAYSSILKALYFSAIVSKENSNYILDLLSKSEFNDKLAAGIPADVLVSHKIGVYENVSVPIYSDCGIVYVPKRQYILCMASRSDEDIARQRMKTISQAVYEFVSTAQPPVKK